VSKQAFVLLRNADRLTRKWWLVGVAVHGLYSLSQPPSNAQQQCLGDARNANVMMGSSNVELGPPLGLQRRSHTEVLPTTKPSPLQRNI
jgi:hypothetical protein